MSRAQLVEIDLHAVTSSEELHSLLMASLGFPSWYGRNWAAFWDAITGLVEMPQTLKLLGWQKFSQCLPRDAALLQERINRMQVEFPQWAPQVVYS